MTEQNQIEQPQESVTLQKPKHKRRWLFWSASFLGIIIGIIVVGIYYFIGTHHGLKQIISFANKWSGYSIKADKFEGYLGDQVTFYNLSISGKGLSFKSEEIKFSWDAGELWHRKILINELFAKDSELILPESTTPEPPAEKEVKEAKEAFEFKDRSLPITFEVQKILIENFQLNKKQAPLFKIDEFSTAFVFAESSLKVTSLIFKSPEIGLETKAEMQIINDYPIRLENNITIHHADLGEEKLDVKIYGDIAKTINLSVLGSGFAKFSWSVELSDILKKAMVDSQLSLENIDLSAMKQDQAALKGQVDIKGSLLGNMALAASGKLHYFSTATQNIQLDLLADLNDKKLDLKSVDLNLVDNQQSAHLTGQFDLLSQAFDVMIDSDKIEWPQKSDTPLATVNQLKLNASGTPNNYQLKGNVKAFAEGVPEADLAIDISGDTKQLSAIHLLTKISEGTLKSQGSMIWSPQLSFDLTTKGDGIKASGKLPAIEGLLLDAKGTLEQFSAHLKGNVHSDIIPKTEMDATLLGSLDQNSSIKALIKTMGGSIDLDATAQIKPDLKVDATLQTKDIALEKLSKQLQSKIDSKITLSAQKSEQELSAKVSIDKLSGEFQKQPLSGKGLIEYKDDKLLINHLEVLIAGNELNANGELGEKLGVDFLVSANHLNRLVPDFTGNINVKGRLDGTQKKPALNIKSQVSNVNYKTNKVGSLALDSNFDLDTEDVKVKLSASDAVLANNHISQFATDISGKINRHDIKLNLVSDQGKANLVAQGGLDLSKQEWKGQLSKLILGQKEIGDWVLQKSSQITASATELDIKQLCLGQKKASICANGSLMTSRGLDVSLTGLKTSRFRKLMPDAFRINTTLDLKSNVKLIDNQPEVSANLVAKGGRVNLAIASGGVRSKIKQLELDFQLKDNKLESIAQIDLENLIKANVQYRMADVTQKNIFLNLKLGSENLDFVPDLFPQITDIDGKLDGDITLSGVVGENLVITGDLGLLKTTLSVPEYGTEIYDLSLKVFAKDKNKFGFSGGAKSKENGVLTLTGEFDPLAKKGEIDINGKNFLVANAKKMRVKVSPEIKASLTQTINVSGEILIPEAMIVPESSDEKVIKTSDDVVLPVTKKEPPENNLLNMDLGIRLGDDVRVASADIETRLLGEIRVIAKPKQVMYATGSIQVEAGELRVYGQLLTIERGRVIFDSGPIEDPALDIRTTREFDEEGITVGADVLGRVSAPEVSLFSTPSMPDSSILSYLLFGKAPDSDSFGAATLLQTSGLVGANTVARDLKHSMGLDVLDLSFTGMEAGKNLTEDIYVGVRSNFFDAINQLLLEYKINSNFKLESAFGSEDDSYADFIYTREKD